MPTYTYGSSVASQIASARRARDNCTATLASTVSEDIRSLNEENERRWDNTIAELIRDCLPHGSGFDSGTTFNEDLSTDHKLVFDTQFHHMKDGLYTRWTSHRITATASFVGNLMITVSGQNHCDIKDYIAEVFYDALTLTPVRVPG